MTSPADIPPTTIIESRNIIAKLRAMSEAKNNVTCSSQQLTETKCSIIKTELQHTALCFPCAILETIGVQDLPTNSQALLFIQICEKEEMPYIRTKYLFRFQ